MFRKPFRIPFAALLGLSAVIPAAHAAIVVSEVSSTSSGSGAYAQDWFELTNTGVSSQGIVGWKMDDSSGSAGSTTNAVALEGVSSIAAGQSVVFLNYNSTSDKTTLANAFRAAWFGASAPADLVVGFYFDGGTGLSSSGGDAVNIFSATDVVQAKVTFGSDGTNRSFDNAQGLNNTAVTLLSTAGTNGAFTSFDGAEIGSPGRIASPVPLPAAAWLLLSGIGALGAAGRRRRAAAA